MYSFKRAYTVLILLFVSTGIMATPIFIPGSTQPGRIQNQVMHYSHSQPLSEGMLGEYEFYQRDKSQQFQGQINYNNFGDRWIGYQRFSAEVTANNLLQKCDQTRLTALDDVNFNRLGYYQFIHNAPIGPYGTWLHLLADYTRVNPTFTLSSPNVDGRSNQFGGAIVHPFYQSDKQQLAVHLGFYASQDKLLSHHEDVAKDYLRTLVVGSYWQFQDPWCNPNHLLVEWRQGLNILGAKQAGSAKFLHPDSQKDFSLLYANAEHIQILTTHFSFAVSGHGQYAFNPLAPRYQFGFGGRRYGRAYDWAELLGDSGVAGRVELRYDTHPENSKLYKNAQYYVSYDIASAWMRDPRVVADQTSASSVAGGVLFDFTRYFSAQLEVSKPLTRDVLSRTLAGKSGDGARVFFRIQAQI